MPTFTKRTVSELNDLDLCSMTHDECEAATYLNMCDSPEHIRQLPGGREHFHRFYWWELSQLEHIVIADNWRHLCSIVGLKEAHAMIFYRVDHEQREPKPYHLPICKAPAGAGNDHEDCSC